MPLYGAGGGGGGGSFGGSIDFNEITPGTIAKRNATTGSPTVTDDNVAGYDAGSLWTNTATGRVFICASAVTGAASWSDVIGVDGGGA